MVGALRVDDVLLVVSSSVRLFVYSFVCSLKRVRVGHWPDSPNSAGGRERPERCWASQASARHTDDGGGLSRWPLSDSVFGCRTCSSKITERFPFFQ